MNFENINLETATDEELLEMELGHVAIQLIALGMSKRLCSLEGREVIAEYGLKGNFDDVVQQLNMYSEALEEIGIVQGSREAIIERKMDLMEHRATADSDDKREAEKLATIMEAIKTRDPKHVIETTLAQDASSDIDDIKIRQDALHEAKLCTCYTN